MSLLSSRSMCALYKNTTVLTGLCKTGWFIIGDRSAKWCPQAKLLQSLCSDEHMALLVVEVTIS